MNSERRYREINNERGNTLVMFVRRLAMNIGTGCYKPKQRKGRASRFNRYLRIETFHEKQCSVKSRTEIYTCPKDRGDEMRKTVKSHQKESEICSR